MQGGHSRPASVTAQRATGPARNRHRPRRKGQQPCTGHRVGHDAQGRARWAPDSRLRERRAHWLRRGRAEGPARQRPRLVHRSSRRSIEADTAEARPSEAVALVPASTPTPAQEPRHSELAQLDAAQPLVHGANKPLVWVLVWVIAGCTSAGGSSQRMGKKAAAAKRPKQAVDASGRLAQLRPDITEARHKLERLEQITLSEPWSAGSSDADWAQARAQAITVARTHRMRALMDRVVAPLREALREAYLHPGSGSAAASPPLQRWRQLTEADRCALLELVLVFTTWQLATQPSSAGDTACDSSGIAKSVDDPTLRRDQIRAHQVLEPARLVLDGELTTPAECRWMSEALRERTEHVASPVPPTRRALGFALEMCGRPNPSHFVDRAQGPYGKQCKTLVKSHRELATISTGNEQLDAWYQQVGETLEVSEVDLQAVGVCAQDKRQARARASQRAQARAKARAKKQAQTGTRLAER